MGNSANPCENPCTQQAPAFEQLIAVVRHGERLDGADPQRWWGSKESKAYPFDCPLTVKGVKQATDAGVFLKGLNHKVDMVVCSPYQRCVLTALAIARVLGTELSIDVELGEVYGPMMMGGDVNAQAPARRGIQEVLNFAQSKADGILLHRDGDFLGVAPDWPETLEEARVRFVCRVETYIEHSTRLGRNFVLVTHGDAVAATAAILLRSCANAVPGNTVTKINYCGLVAATRVLNDETIMPIGYPSPGTEFDQPVAPAMQLANKESKWKVSLQNVNTSSTRHIAGFTGTGATAGIGRTVSDEDVQAARAASQSAVRGGIRRSSTVDLLAARFGAGGTLQAKALDDLPQEPFSITYPELENRKSQSMASS